MTNRGAAVDARIIRRDRVVVLSSLLGITALAWLVTLSLAAGMDTMMPADLMLTAASWVVMMVAMMTPTVLPTLLLYTNILRSRAQQPGPYRDLGPVGAAREPFALASLFLLGYLIIWSGFSVTAALAQTGLHDALSGAALITAIVLVSAGVFQFTPVKHTCLSRCRSPQGFFMTEWREGARGALVMGMKNGLFCLVCCWLLMAILFVAGAMNMVWMVGIAILVLAEKAAPFGEWTSRAAGVALISVGAWMAMGAI
jgi:predicted metal-binding membrane protein